jgi:hypothetical protein
MLFFLVGCESYHLSHVPEGNGTSSAFLEGHEFAVSTKKNTLISVAGFKTTQNDLILRVFCENISEEQRINFIPENITVKGFSKNGDQRNFQAYSTEEYLKKMRRNHTWAAALMAISVGLDSLNGGYSTSTTHGTSYGSIYDRYGERYNGYVSSSYTTRSYDPKAAAEQRDLNTKQVSSFVNQQNEIYATTENSLIKANTLAPQQTLEGNVIVKIYPTFSSKFIINIPLGKEIHEITFIPKR